MLVYRETNTFSSSGGGGGITSLNANFPPNFPTFLLEILRGSGIDFFFGASRAASTEMRTGPKLIGGHFDSANNNKRQRRKRQPVTAKREKSQTQKFV